MILAEIDDQGRLIACGLSANLMVLACFIATIVIGGWLVNCTEKFAGVGAAIIVAAVFIFFGSIGSWHLAAHFTEGSCS